MPLPEVAHVMSQEGSQSKALAIKKSVLIAVPYGELVEVDILRDHMFKSDVILDRISTVAVPETTKENFEGLCVQGSIEIVR